MRLPVEIEAAHEGMVRGRESGQLVLHYNRGRLMSVDENRKRNLHRSDAEATDRSSMQTSGTGEFDLK